MRRVLVLLLLLASIPALAQRNDRIKRLDVNDSKSEVSPYYDVTHRNYGADADLSAGVCDVSGTSTDTSACSQWYCSDDATTCSCNSLEYDGACDKVDVTGDVCDGIGDGRCYSQDSITNDQSGATLAIDAAYADGGGTVYFPYQANPYIVEALKMKPGVSIKCDPGAIIKQSANANKWDRVFDFNDSAFSGSADDYDPVVIDGCTIDGNRENRGDYTGYEQEQAAGIWVFADAATAGRTKVTINNVSIRDTTGDCLSLYTNVDAQISNVSCTETFRGGLTISGGNTTAQVSNLRSKGDLHVGGFNIEPSADGFGSTRRTDIYATNVDIDGSFDISVEDDSFVAISGFRSRGKIGDGLGASGTITVNADDDAVIRISDFDITVGHDSPSTANRIMKPNDVTFHNGKFTLQEPPVDSDNYYEAIQVNWGTGGDFPTGQRLYFRDVHFEVDGAATGTDFKVGITSKGQTTSSDNKIICDGCTFSADYDWAVEMAGGGYFEFIDNECYSDDCFRISADNIQVSNVTVRGGKYEPVSDYVSVASVNYAHTMTHYDVHVDGDSFGSYDLSESNFANMSFSGGRTMYYATAPTAANTCLYGDEAIIGNGRETYHCDDERRWVQRDDADFVGYNADDSELFSTQITGSTTLQVGRGEIFTSIGKIYMRIGNGANVNAVNYIEMVGPETLKYNFTCDQAYVSAPSCQFDEYLPGGYTDVDVGEQYTTVAGFGWSDGSFVNNCRERAVSGQDNESSLCFVQASNTLWEADVTSGRYSVTIGIGDDSNAVGPTTIDVSGDNSTWVNFFTTESTGSGIHATASKLVDDSRSCYGQVSGSGFFDNDCDGVLDADEGDDTGLVFDGSAPTCDASEKGRLWWSETPIDTGITCSATQPCLTACMYDELDAEYRWMFLFGARLSAFANNSLCVGGSNPGTSCDQQSDCLGGGTCPDIDDYDALGSLYAEVIRGGVMYIGSVGPRETSSDIGLVFDPFGPGNDCSITYDEANTRYQSDCALYWSGDQTVLSNNLNVGDAANPDANDQCINFNNTHGSSPGTICFNATTGVFDVDTGAGGSASFGNSVTIGDNTAVDFALNFDADTDSSITWNTTTDRLTTSADFSVLGKLWPADDIQFAGSADRTLRSSDTYDVEFLLYDSLGASATEFRWQEGPGDVSDDPLMSLDQATGLYLFKDLWVDSLLNCDIESDGSGKFTCGTDENTNAGTICATGELLNGDGTCETISTTTDKFFSFRSLQGASGESFVLNGGFYIEGATNKDFQPTVSFGDANAAYGAHIYIVTDAATVNEVTIEVSGTSITDAGVRTAADTENIVIPNATAAHTYYETSKKWIGTVDIDKLSGTDTTSCYGWVKYWDNMNTDFTVTAIDANWLGGANDAGFDLRVYHHDPGGTWTCDGSGSIDPPELETLQDTYVTEYNARSGEFGAWKLTGLSHAISGSTDEGIVIGVVTTANSAIDYGTIQVQISQ